jgi:hypothetical protein
MELDRRRVVDEVEEAKKEDNNNKQLYKKYFGISPIFL